MVGRHNHGLTNRRTVLKTLGASGAIALAGCTGGDGSGDGGDGSGDGGNGGDGGDGASDSSNGGSTGNGGTEITLLTLRTEPSDKEIINNIAEAFEEETGNSLNPIYVGSSEIPSRMSTMLRGGNAPDIVQAAGVHFAAPLEAGHMHDASDLIDRLAEGAVGQIPDGAVIKGADGTVAGVPWGINCYHDVFRADLLEQGGEPLPEWSRDNVDPLWDYDRTYEDHRREVEAIASVEGIDAGQGISIASNSRGATEGEWLLDSNGATLYEQNDDGTFEVKLGEEENRQRAINALEWFRDDVGPSLATSADWGFSDMTSELAREQYGSVWYRCGAAIGPFRQQGMEDHIGDLVPLKPAQKNEPDDGFRFKISLQTLGIFDRPETNTDVAEDFVEFMMTSDAYFDFFHGTPLSTMPPTPSLIRSDAHMDHETIQEYRHIAEFSARELESGAAMSYLVRWGGVNLNYAQMHNNGVWGDMLFRVLEDGADPASAVDAAVEEMNSYEE